VIAAASHMKLSFFIKRVWLFIPIFTASWCCRLLQIAEIPHCRSPKFPRCRAGRRGGGDCSQRLVITSSPRSSATAIGASQHGQAPPRPTRRMNVPQVSQRCWPIFSS
jgi:hypothetical protein